MLEVLEDPVIRARAFPISVEGYHHLFDLGEIPVNVELIRGAVVKKMPKTPLHSYIVEMLRAHLEARLPEGYFTRQEQPITLADSEPEPDVAVIQGEPRQYFKNHPKSAELVIEVCVSTEHLDRVKLGLYAEAGVRECWLLLAESRVLERHTEPEGTAYRRVERATFPITLESTLFPGLALPPEGVFPA